jgi:hypothetical protein
MKLTCNRSRRRRLPATILAAAILATTGLAATGLATASGTVQASVLTPAAHPAGAAPAHRTAHLAIRQVRVGDTIPIEGAVSFIRVKRPSGTVVLTRRLPASDRLTLRLRPGRYRLVSWQRTCDANCGTLDPPSDRCSRALTLRPGARLHATIRINFATGCVIRLHR